MGLLLLYQAMKISPSQATAKSQGEPVTSEQTDAIKEQVAAHWSRRAAHFDEDL
jgi:hypothetical protein